MRVRFERNLTLFLFERRAILASTNLTAPSFGWFAAGRSQGINPKTLSARK